MMVCNIRYSGKCIPSFNDVSFRAINAVNDPSHIHKRIDFGEVKDIPGKKYARCSIDIDEL